MGWIELRGQAFLDIKKKKLLEESGAPNRLAVTKTQLLLGCSETSPPGPAGSQPVGAWELPLL